MKAAPEPLLRLRDWSLVRRVPGGEVTVLNGIDLDLQTDQWLTVIGANGSGKSSLLKFLASDDSPLAVRAGIMFQDPDEQIFASSVEREVVLGRPGLDSAAILAEFGLGELARMDPALISAGQKQRLALAVALSGEPRVLFCDEPTALQDPVQAAWVLDRLGQWRRQTRGCLVTTTCDRREAVRADRLVVLQEGRIILEGRPEDLMGHPEVVALLGDEDHRPPGTAPARAAGRGVLALAEVRCCFHAAGGGFGPLDLDLGPGDRLGIIGPNGCGKSTLLASCAGARRPDGGWIRVGGRPLYGRKERDLDHGGALLAPQFPEYLFSRSTVADEISLDPALAARRPESFLEDLGLDTALVRRNPHDLSSGQRRRLALGLVIHSHRPLLLLDEPTAALDRKGREMVLGLLDKVPASSALVIASHDASFLTAAGCEIRELGSGGWADPPVMPQAP